MKKNILIFLLGVLTTSIVGVTASYLYQANEISYNDTTVENALNELYTRTEDYVELTSNTTVTPQGLLNGITAYNKNGELVTGILTPNSFETMLVVDGDVGTKSELNLKSNAFTKFKFSDLKCSSGNTTSIYTYDKDFQTKNNINSDIIYQTGDSNYRLYLEKTGGYGYCRIKITLFN